METLLKTSSKSEVLTFLQWRTFSNIIKKIPIDTPLIAAVYYHRRDTLVLPGSNLHFESNSLDSPQKLCQILKESCPHPDTKDSWAAAVTCKYFFNEQNNDNKYDHILVAKDVCGKNYSKALLWHIENLQYQKTNISLRWPKEFKKFIGSIFARSDCHIRKVVFIACPLKVWDHDHFEQYGPQHLEHVGFFYFGIQDTEADERKLGEWVQPLRDLMTWGVLTYELQKETVWKARLDFIKTCESREEIKKFAPKNEEQNIIKQASYLKKMRNNEPHSRLLFPIVSRIERDPIPFYSMPMYNLPSLRTLLCNQNCPTKEQLNLILRRLLESLFDEIYVRTQTQLPKTSSKWAEKIISSRKRRLTSILEDLDQLQQGKPVSVKSSIQLIEERNSHKVIRYLLTPSSASVRNIKVTDSHYRNSQSPEIVTFPFDIFDNNQIYKRLASMTPAPIHGDLHFNNILLDAHFPDEPIFVLIDPHGEEAGDPAYDIGKLLYSCETGYDFVDTGHFDVNVLVKKPQEYLVNVVIPSTKNIYLKLQEGASTAGLVKVGRSLSPNTVELYKEASKIILQTAESLGKTKLGDNNLVDRAIFYQGLLCLTPTENLYLQNPDCALALLSRGCHIISDWKNERCK